ncbi:MAG TPA: HD domain-containing protein [Firmicutes bacterium]|jgi:uncharacterized protein|nr:HD domain-containing protein [Bacillota bacterium]HHT41811.1 HD domain-containing protein [Bacillota bacterium]
MDLDAMRELAHKAMVRRCTHPDRERGFVYYHGQRVAEIALQLRELIFPGEESWDEVITAAGWFHDVGKGIEPHWEYGALLVREMLKDHCSPQELEQIAEIVGSHTLRKQREYPPYVQLVQDADILDHFGTLDIWLDFWHCACRGKGLEDALEFYGDEYLQKVESVASLLNFPESVEILQEKMLFAREFAERFRREAAGELILKRKKAKD